MTALPICEKLRRFAATGRERRSTVAINSFHAASFDEAADTIDALYGALGYLMSTSTIEDSNRDAMRQALAVLAKARGQ